MSDMNRLITLKDLMVLKAELISEFKKNTSGTNRADSKKWLKTNEVRKMLGLSNGTLQTMRNNNMITFSRIGRNIYYLESEIHAMLEEKSNKNAQK